MEVQLTQFNNIVTDNARDIVTMWNAQAQLQP
jgi:hypothetical protein